MLVQHEVEQACVEHTRKQNIIWSLGDCNLLMSYNIACVCVCSLTLPRHCLAHVSNRMYANTHLHVNHRDLFFDGQVWVNEILKIIMHPPHTNHFRNQSSADTDWIPNKTFTVCQQMSLLWTLSHAHARARASASIRCACMHSCMHSRIRGYNVVINWCRHGMPPPSLHRKERWPHSMCPRAWRPGLALCLKWPTNSNGACMLLALPAGVSTPRTLVKNSLVKQWCCLFVLLSRNWGYPFPRDAPWKVVGNERIRILFSGFIDFRSHCYGCSLGKWKWQSNNRCWWQRLRPRWWWLANNPVYCSDFVTGQVRLNESTGFVCAVVQAWDSGQGWSECLNSWQTWFGFQVYLTTWQKWRRLCEAGRSCCN